MAAFLLVICTSYLLLGVFFGFYIPCPFRLLTGLKCPGCGLSHAAVCLARLDFEGAFHENALFAPIFLFMIYEAFRYFIPLMNNKDPHTDKISMRIEIIFLVVLLIWWVVRNVFSL